MKRPGRLLLGLISFALAWGSTWAGLAEVSSFTEPTNAAAPTNAEAAAAYLHLQEQIHATHLAVERNRQEADAASARNAALLADRLQTIEQSLAGQRARELEEIQKSNRLMLTLTGAFAGIGLLALFGMAYFQWQTVSRLAALSGVPPGVGVPALAPGRSYPRLGPGDSVFAGMDALEQTNRRWNATLARLEQRITELEQTARPPLRDAPVNNLEPNGTGEESAGPPRTAEKETPATEGHRVSALLAKGQLLLNLGQPTDALPVLEEALALEPANGEALVKKGAALEQLGRLDEAVACYDEAIAADGSLTIAYLCKGGLFNRMQRFQEALECYEQALHTHEKSAA